ncbi:hypothetical protein JCM10914A_50500 [Paenibacillus sp. JCM 10914]|uniref:PAS domain-containing sensor histidine kinase n=1 Tax=Paenibacillus sp. JCM 10914 TaxID=1236974 RepID=UPI0003CC44F0|nr:PAS domain-containing sensor histidine kinase [Paenibacillus sp. JCM 10914]GAE08311.1 two-component sensor histidine kinase [Paenibacillus sp. JCM 10914]
MLSNSNPGFVFEHAMNGMAIVSYEGTILKVNAALCKLLGYSQAALISGDVNDQSIHDLWDQISHRIRNLTESDQHELQSFETTCSRKSLSPLKLAVHMQAIQHEHAMSSSYLIQFTDQTPLDLMRHKLEQQNNTLMELNDSYQQLLDQLPLAVLITRKGIVQYTNPAGLRLVKAGQLSDVLGMSTNTIVDASSHQDLFDRRQRYAEVSTLGEITYVIRCLDGQQKVVHGFSFIITHEGEKAVIGVFKDITEQRIEEDRIMQSERLTTAGQLAAGIAHEIRNPLTSINGFLKLLRSGERSSPLYFDIIESELKRIELIVNELLVLSKPQTAHISGPIDVFAMLEQIITLMKVQAALKDIEIIPHYPITPVTIRGEVNQLKQVFINLLKNALEAMTHGGIITIDIQQIGQDVQIIVKDQGVGMTPEQMKSLGEPFYTTKDSGTGLGLMITKNIIHNHGGTLDVFSIPEQGTTFTIHLPSL